MKKNTAFHLKIVSFTAVNYYSILFGRVIIMEAFVLSIILYKFLVLAHLSRGRMDELVVYTGTHRPFVNIFKLTTFSETARLFHKATIHSLDLKTQHFNSSPSFHIIQISTIHIQLPKLLRNHLRIH